MPYLTPLGSGHPIGAAESTASCDILVSNVFFEPSMLAAILIDKMLPCHLSLKADELAISPCLSDPPRLRCRLCSTRRRLRCDSRCLAVLARLSPRLPVASLFMATPFFERLDACGSFCKDGE